MAEVVETKKRKQPDSTPAVDANSTPSTTTIATSSAAIASAGEYYELPTFTLENIDPEFRCIVCLGWLKLPVLLEAISTIPPTPSTCHHNVCAHCLPNFYRTSLYLGNGNRIKFRCLKCSAELISTKKKLLTIKTNDALWQKILSAPEFQNSTSPCGPFSYRAYELNVDDNSEEQHTEACSTPKAYPFRVNKARDKQRSFLPTEKLSSSSCPRSDRESVAFAKPNRERSGSCQKAHMWVCMQPSANGNVALTVLDSTKPMLKHFPSLYTAPVSNARTVKQVLPVASLIELVWTKPSTDTTGINWIVVGVRQPTAAANVTKTATNNTKSEDEPLVPISEAIVARAQHIFTLFPDITLPTFDWYLAPQNLALSTTKWTSTSAVSTDSQTFLSLYNQQHGLPLSTPLTNSDSAFVLL